ncbi:hypothetical protein JW916_08385 [Candidatus Sumerlaeota bacterium]|nr:hypothetical protein [Candidatus Sumerlaeota bacterium]
MRTLIESRHVLVIETPGRIMFGLTLGLVALHGSVVYSQTVRLVRDSLSTGAYINLSVACLIYLILLYLALGPLADKKTVTFHGAKNSVGIERRFPFGWTIGDAVEFGEFECFEISRPEARGFCRIRFKDGKTRHLLNLPRDGEMSGLEHLDQITHMKVEFVA